MKIATSRLTLREPFKSLFPVEPDVVKELTADMKVNGFDAAQSIFAWKAPDGQLVVVDGHMRLQSAKAARLGEVHVTVRKFADEDEAFAFAIKLQRVRRNLSKLEIAEAITRAEAVKQPMIVQPIARSLGSPKGVKSGARGSTKDPVTSAVVEKAAKLGISERTAKQALANVRAVDGKSRATKQPTRAARTARAVTNAVVRSRSDEALDTYHVVALVNNGELAPHMHSTLRAMVKLADGLDHRQAETAVSAVWGVVDGAYRDKRRPTDLVKIATSKEKQ